MEKTMNAEQNTKQVHLSKKDVEGFKQYQEWMKEYENLSAQICEARAEENNAYDNGYKEGGPEYAEEKRNEAHQNTARLEKELEDLKKKSTEENLFKKEPTNVSECDSPLTFESYLQDRANNGDKSAEKQLEDWNAADMIILDDGLEHDDIPETMIYKKKSGNKTEILTEDELKQKEEQESEKTAEQEVEEENKEKNKKHDRFVQKANQVSKPVESEPEYQNGGY